MARCEVITGEEEQPEATPSRAAAGQSESAESQDESADQRGFQLPPPRVTFSADGVEAYLTLFEAGVFSLEQVTHAIERAGVEAVDWLKVEGLVVGVEPCEVELIARGQPSNPPEDARIEYLFHRHRPAEHGGRIDWHDLGTIISVTENTPLARRIPGVEGTPGRTATGKVIHVRTPKDVELRLGLGVERSPEDPDLAIAVMAGAVKRDATGKLEIDNLKVVDGDVSVATGDVDYNGCLVIKGSVKPGYRVEATADIEVVGTIESAVVIAGGSVRADGILGNESTWVGAKRNIYARFANNAALKAGADVHLQREAVNCSVEADGRVIVGGPNPDDAGTIKGGSISAGHAVEASRVGGELTVTRLRSGRDWVIPPKIEAAKQQIEVLRTELKKIPAALERLETMDLDSMPGKVQLMEQLQEALAERASHIGNLEREVRRLTLQLRQPGSIIVRGPIVAGTELILDGKTRVLEQAEAHVHFSREGNSVISIGLKD